MNILNKKTNTLLMLAFAGMVNADAVTSSSQVLSVNIPEIEPVKVYSIVDNGCSLGDIICNLANAVYRFASVNPFLNSVNLVTRYYDYCVLRFASLDKFALQDLREIFKEISAKGIDNFFEYEVNYQIVVNGNAYDVKITVNDYDKYGYFACIIRDARIALDEM